MIPREANGEESGLEAWNGCDTLVDFFIGVDAIYNIVVTYSFLTICDKNDCQLLQVGITFDKIFDHIEANHEVCSTASTDILDSVIVSGLVLAGEFFAVVVVEESVELLKRTFLGVIVFLTDEFSTKLECINGCTCHGA